MEEKTNIVPYNSAGNNAQQPSPPQQDYSNSNRKKMGQHPVSASISAPQSGVTEGKTDGFFKATLKQAIDHAIKTVVDPMIRNFMYTTGMSVLNTLLWNGGKGSPGTPTVFTNTPYNLISSPISVQQSPKPQMTQQDRVWQRYEKLHVDTLDQANAIMSRMYREYMQKGHATLATYYEAFGERYDFTNEAWGWNSLPRDGMYAQQFADGYHVIMPKLEKLL